MTLFKNGWAYTSCCVRSSTFEDDVIRACSCSLIIGKIKFRFQVTEGQDYQTYLSMKCFAHACTPPSCMPRMVSYAAVIKGQRILRSKMKCEYLLLLRKGLLQNLQSFYLLQRRGLNSSWGQVQCSRPFLCVHVPCTDPGGVSVND